MKSERIAFAVPVGTRAHVAVISIAALASMFVGGFAAAQTTDASMQSNGQGRFGEGMHRGVPGIVGTVDSVNGTTLTVTQSNIRPDQGGASGTSGRVYTVDASGAVVMKDRENSTLSAVAVGDTVMITGTFNGTSITAKTIHDGVLRRGPGVGEGRPDAVASIQGNGQPIVAGTVSSVSGNSFALGTKAGASYSVDASNAMIVKRGATSSISAIAAGDAVVVQGVVNGSAVTATSVVDHGTAQRENGISNDADVSPRGEGFLGMLGGFFHRIFNFGFF